MRNFVKFLVSWVMMFLTALLEGWVLTYLWGWFIVPVFALPELTLVPAVGLCLVVGFLTFQHSSVHFSEEDEDEETKRWVHLYVAKILTPFIVLLAGYLFSRFM